MSAQMTATQPLPLVTRSAIVRAVSLGLESLRARPPMHLSDWAEKHFVLAGESSQQRGGWKAWPFQVGIMDDMSNDDIEELDVFKAKRIGYTKMLTASVGFDAAWRRRNQALWQPTDDDRDSFVKTEIDPMIEGVAAVASVRRVVRGSEDTMKYKQFRDSVLHLLGGKAARAYRRITVAVAKIDEVDAFDRLVEKSINPVEGARGRLEGAPFPKLIVGSTPRIKGLSHIEDRATTADVDMRYRINCIHCGVEHPIIFGSNKIVHGFKWDAGEPDTVRHVCPHCHGAIRQAEYLQNAVGAWVCDRTGIRQGVDKTWRDHEGAAIKAPRHVAKRPWAALSPQRAWSDIVREFMQATAAAKTGDRGHLMTFINETLGETWEEKGDSADGHALERRAEPYRLRTVPMGGLVLVAGVDVQDNRWEVVVWAIGRGEEMWVVDYVVLPANPADLREWDEKLDPYLQSTFLHDSGVTLRIEAAAIDTGGHFTHQAYQFSRLRERRRIFAIKGESQPGKPVAGKASPQDVNVRGQIVKRGVKLWMVGTDSAKDLIYGRLMVERPGPGYMHFSADLPPDFYRGLTVEQRVRVKTSTGEVYRWVNPFQRPNEPLDCTGYAIFCTHRLGLDKYTGAMWSRLEDAVQPRNADMFMGDAPPAASDAPAEVPSVRLPSGRISLKKTNRFTEARA